VLTLKDFAQFCSPKKKKKKLPTAAMSFLVSSSIKNSRNSYIENSYMKKRELIYDLSLANAKGRNLLKFF